MKIHPHAPSPASMADTASSPASPALAPPQSVELLSPPQLARRLGISRRCLSNWTHDRLIPMIKIGRTCRFDFAKVRAALEQYEQPAASPAPPAGEGSSRALHAPALPTTPEPGDSEGHPPPERTPSSSASTRNPSSVAQ